MSQKLLVVGDKLASVAAVLDCLGLEITQMADSLDALREIAQRRFSLVVYSTPSFSAELLNFCVALRTVDPEIPFAVSSGKTGPAERAAVLNKGADEVLDTELSQVEQLARVAALLRRGAYKKPLEFSFGQEQYSKSYRIDDLEVDIDKKQAWMRGKLLSLTPTEYNLLETLALHSGKTLSQSQLSDKIWGYDSDVYENNIKWHVCRLRKKLGVNRSAPEYILTVRNRGYRLRLPEETAAISC